MGKSQQCLNRLFMLSDAANTLDHRQVAVEVDGVLACCGRHACSSQLACSWLASELARSLMQRYC